MSVYELLLECPASMAPRVRMALKAIAVGDWDDAAHQLRIAARGGNTTWHKRATEIACKYDRTPYNGIEIAGCVTTEGGFVRPLFEAGIKPDFYTVYLQCVEGGVEAVRDFKSYKSAARYAEKLAAKHGLQIVDFVRGGA